MDKSVERGQSFLDDLASHTMPTVGRALAPSMKRSMNNGARPGEEHAPAGDSDLGPEPLSEDMPPPTPWPRDCMPAGMAEAAEAIADHVQAPEALGGMAVLGAVAHVAMRLVDARHPKKGALPASLYILTSLVSGGRKSECFSVATAPIAKLERAAREAHKAELKRLAAEAAQANGHCSCGHPG